MNQCSGHVSSPKCASWKARRSAFGAKTVVSTYLCDIDEKDLYLCDGWWFECSFPGLFRSASANKLLAAFALLSEAIGPLRRFFARHRVLRIRNLGQYPVLAMRSAS